MQDRVCNETNVLLVPPIDLGPSLRVLTIDYCIYFALFIVIVHVGGSCLGN